MELIEEKSYRVECEFDNSHVIEKTIETKPGTKNVESTFHVYCPYCNKWSNGKVLGELHPDKALLREYGFDDDLD